MNIPTIDLAQTGANWIRLAGDKKLCLDCYDSYDRFNV